MKTRKPNKAQRELAKQWEALKQNQSKPLERGAKSKSAKAKGKAPSKMPKLVIPEERDSRHIASLDTGKGTAAIAQTLKYTGTKMLGVAQMHKSNQVPIFTEEHIEDVAKMRR